MKMAEEIKKLYVKKRCALCKSWCEGKAYKLFTRYYCSVDCVLKERDFLVAVGYFDGAPKAPLNYFKRIEIVTNKKE